MTPILRSTSGKRACAAVLRLTSDGSTPHSLPTASSLRPFVATHTPAESGSGGIHGRKPRTLWTSDTRHFLRRSSFSTLRSTRLTSQSHCRRSLTRRSWRRLSTLGAGCTRTLYCPEAARCSKTSSDACSRISASVLLADLLPTCDACERPQRKPPLKLRLKLCLTRCSATPSGSGARCLPALPSSTVFVIQKRSIMRRARELHDIILCLGLACSCGC